MKQKFVKVLDPSHLIPTIEKRLPVSCFIYNQLKSYEKFKDDIEISTYGENDPDTLWLVAKFYRKDYGMWINISAPSEQHGIPDEVKQSIASGELQKWEEPFIFASLQMHVCKMIMNMILDEGKNIVAVYPCYLFHMKPEDALKLDTDTPPGIQLKRLEPSTGTPFISDNWKYSREGTLPFVRKSIEHLPSGGVYLGEEEELVCGAITTGFGLISMLHTDPEHRRKGYASMAMRFILKETVQEGLLPCLVTELENTTAVNFQRSLGLTLVARVAFIRNYL